LQIEVKGRHVAVTDTLRQQVERRFAKVARQVSASSTLEVELTRERNPANPVCEVAEATVRMKGATLRAREASRTMPHAINLVADDIARQVKRVRDKRRGPRAGEGFEAPAAGTM